MALRTRRGVEIARVGTWKASTGEWNCTRSQLAAAVRAQHDKAFRTPVVKAGHIDPRFDGEPALGQVRNLRVEDGGDSLVGDLVIPDWLDDALPSAYPSRSVEALLAATTPDGESYEMVVTGLALLGVTRPAIQSLAELQSHFADTSQGGYVAAMAIAASAGDRMDDFTADLEASVFSEAAHPRAPKGSPGGGKFVAQGSGYKSTGKSGEAGDVKNLQGDLIRLGFLGEHDGKNGHGQDGLFGPKTEAAVRAFQKAHGLPVTGRMTLAEIKALTATKSTTTTKTSRKKTSTAKVKAAAEAAGFEVREIWSDYVIAAEDDGRFWRVPWSEDGDNVMFAGPEQVQVSYTPVAGPIAAAVNDARRPLYFVRDRAATSPKERHQVDSTLLRERLLKAGATVPEDATDEQMLAALDAVLTSQDSRTPATDDSRTPAIPSSDSTENQSRALPDVGALVAAAVASAKEEFAATISDLGSQIAKRNADDATALKRSVLASARDAGKIRPADMDSWGTRYDRSPDVTTEILAALPPGVAVPVTASGRVSITDVPDDSSDGEWAQIAAAFNLPAGSDL